MRYPQLREELKAYYWHKADSNAKTFFEKCTGVMDAEADATLPVYEMKAFQYTTISELFEPILFYNSPFYYETGTLSAHCDGARDFRGHRHAGGWTYRKNEFKFINQDEELWGKRCKQHKELFYLICGPYNDTSQHFYFNCRPIFKTGLKGVYENACDALKTADTTEQIEFLNTLCEGLLCIKRSVKSLRPRRKKWRLSPPMLSRSST